MNAALIFARRLVSTKLPLLALALATTLGVRSVQAEGSGGSLEREVLSQVNFARTQPARYAEFLDGFRAHYQGNLFVVPGQRPVITHEGAHALEEAVRAMRHARPLPPLSTSDGLSLAAADLTRDQSITGAIGHHGGGGSPFQRMSRHGRWEAHAGEAIDYGGATARRIVANLIIDDGVRDRGHRLNLLSADFAFAGVACATHPRYRQMCVIDFAWGFDDGGGDRGRTTGSPAVKPETPAPRRLMPIALSTWRRGQ